MKFSIIFLQIILVTLIISEPDPNFYIFLAFGDANMEGNVLIEQEDVDDVSDRFLMMPAIEKHKFNRVFGNWYKAYPPLCRPWGILSTLDFFGRSLTKNLPENIKVGVINVAITGSSIDIFDEDMVDQYLNSTKDYIRDIARDYYGGHPFKALMNAAKKAQESGVIKGILVHQGSDKGYTAWPYKLKLIYQRMLQELHLNGDDVPLLVGEIPRKEQNGYNYAHNQIIANVPSVIPNSFIASSEVDIQSDNATLVNREVYKTIGKRFAELYITYLGMEFYDPDPNFYIFLAFGDSNMEGSVPIEQADIDDVSDRFLMMPAINMTRFDRVSGEWYKATPPLCREYCQISSLDFFGRALTKNLPKNIKVGVINVAVSSSSLDIFDEDKVEEYLNSAAEDYVKFIAQNNYNGHPYKVLIDAAKKAQKYGVIKGILVHHGSVESGFYDWPDKLKLLYEKIIKELNLKIYNVPLLIGELSICELNKYYHDHNNLIAQFPSIYKNAFVASSEVDIESEDLVEIRREVYKTIGKRFAKSYINYLGMEFIDPDA